MTMSNITHSCVQQIGFAHAIKKKRFYTLFYKTLGSEVRAQSFLTNPEFEGSNFLDLCSFYFESGILYRMLCVAVLI